MLLNPGGQTENQGGKSKKKSWNFRRVPNFLQKCLPTLARHSAGAPELFLLSACVVFYSEVLYTTTLSSTLISTSTFP